MSGNYQLQDNYITGGAENSRLTPNFRLKEFLLPDGSIYIHRELVAGLQILRDQLGAAVKIVQPNPPGHKRGLGLVIVSANLDALNKQARVLSRQGYFSQCRTETDSLYLEIPDPGHMPPISAKTAFGCGVQVTAAFETSGDPYLQVTGNFDGAGLSFGPIQCNLGSGTLQELFRHMRGENEQLLQHCFEDQEDYRTFWQILDGSRKQAVAWADQISTGNRKQGFSQPWKSYLQCVGQEPLFRQVMLRYAYDKYGKLLMAALAFLSGVSRVRITNLRCLAALYDMGVQQGSLKKAYTGIRQRVAMEQPADQFALTRITVEERAKKASAKWRADCLSRRLSILERRPVSVTLEGNRARRSNPKVYLLRNSKVKGLERYLVG
jgi:hypothetical protein